MRHKNQGRQAKKGGPANARCFESPKEKMGRFRMIRRRSKIVYKFDRTLCIGYRKDEVKSVKCQDVQEKKEKKRTKKEQKNLMKLLMNEDEQSHDGLTPLTFPVGG